MIAKPTILFWCFATLIWVIAIVVLKWAIGRTWRKLSFETVEYVLIGLSFLFIVGIVIIS